MVLRGDCSGAHVCMSTRGDHRTASIFYLHTQSRAPSSRDWNGSMPTPTPLPPEEGNCAEVKHWYVEICPEQHHDRHAAAWPPLPEGHHPRVWELAGTNSNEI